METHSSILAWEILWTEQPDGLQFMESKRVGHDLVTKQQQTMEELVRQRKWLLFNFLQTPWSVACQAPLSYKVMKYQICKMQKKWWLAACLESKSHLEKFGKKLIQSWNHYLSINAKEIGKILNLTKLQKKKVVKNKEKIIEKKRKRK